MHKYVAGALLFLHIHGTAYAEKLSEALPVDCGSKNTGPFGSKADQYRRPCGPAQPRAYRPKHQGIAKAALDFESEACFVPDQSYQLLDQVVDAVRLQAAKEGLTAQHPDRKQLVTRLSAITAEVMTGHGFLLWVPTETLGDALHYRQRPGEAPRHIYDCDTGSLILLEVAGSYGLDASLVDITLPSGNGHNYVRWALADGTSLDWDVNEKAVCITPNELPPGEGATMNAAQAMAYLRAVRAAVWEHRSMYAAAYADYQESLSILPYRAGTWNNIAWLIATKEFEGRGGQKQLAVNAARKAIASQETPSRLDTLACALAYQGDFSAAIVAQQRAVDGNPDHEGFARRLAMFQASPPRDCTGEE